MTVDMEALAFIAEPCPPESVEKIQRHALAAYHRDVDANCPTDMVASSPAMIDEAVEREGRACRLIGVRFSYEQRDAL